LRIDANFGSLPGNTNDTASGHKNDYAVRATGGRDACSGDHGGYTCWHFIGTDFNNDGNLCDPGEICGSHPIGSFPEPIIYDGVALGLDVPLVVTALRR
jgi:hypothetical protein